MAGDCADVLSIGVLNLGIIVYPPASRPSRQGAFHANSPEFTVIHHRSLRSGRARCRARVPVKPVQGATKAEIGTGGSESINPFLVKYCNNCHGGTKPKADLNLTAFRDVSSIVRGRKVWGRIKDSVDSGEMPPEGKPQPSQEEVGRFLKGVDAVLGKIDCVKESDPGRVTLRRLNREEYNNTIRDLVGIDFHPADDFPSDDVGYGFDNIGDVLTLPPILFEKYLDAAEKIGEQAIVVTGPTGSKGPVKTIEVEDLPDKAGGGRYNDWRGLWLRSERSSPITPFRDGDYILRARAFGQQAGPDATKMAFVIDGKVLKTVEVKAVEKEPQVYEYRVKLRGGARKVGVSFLNDYYNEKAPDPKQRDRNLVVDYLEIQGPAVTADSPKPESHKKIIFKTATRANAHEVAQEILVKFASRCIVGH